MSLALKRTSLTDKKIEQTFNLKKLLGYSPSEEQKKAFFELAVDAIVERTSSGKDINGNTFKPYTKEYAAKKGVTRGSVDLILTGEMLSSFQEGSSKDSVKIAMESDVTGKAHGNITGSYGKTPKKSRARDFFGFKNEKDLEPILAQVDSLKETQIKLGDVSDLAQLRRIVASTIDIDFEGFDGES